MNRTRFFALLLACAATLLAIASSPRAQAQLAADANYFGSDDCGAITVTGAPGTRYQIFGEQSDGSYVLISAGMLKDSGSVSTGVVPTGVIGNGTPMFMVRAWNASGDCEWIPVSISASDDHLWGWS